jgi:putative membrane protein
MSAASTRIRNRGVANLVALTLALWVAVAIIDGLTFDGEVWAFLVVAVLLAVVNAFVKPILTLLSIPFIVLTLGVFLLVVNAITFALVLWVAGPDVLDLGFATTGFGATFLGALVISVVSWVVGLILK